MVDKDKDPRMDGSGDTPPQSSEALNFKDVGSYGLRQFGGWVREEFLRALVGREGARTYREMGDNSPTVGAILFCIIQMMRRVEWRITPADDTDEAQKEADFVQSIMDDMSHTWEDFVAEALSMLQYGYSVHEIVYKKREGRTGTDPSNQDDGRIGIKRLPIRGQDTILKWFFDSNGQVTGVTQQPWVGPLVDLPAAKLLLFRPMQHKNNPEGRSILRSAYRPYYFCKRIEEQEAILFERFSGFPVMSVPSALLSAAAAGDPAAVTAVENYKKIITNVRIDEQMGLLKPSDHFTSGDGTISAAEMYKFELVTPASARASVNPHQTIERYKLDILTSMLADFITTGHASRGTQSSAIQKVDIFFQAIEGWLKAIAAVLNKHLLPKLWELNNLDDKLMPKFAPDMAQRIDLDALGNFVLHLAQAGMMMFPDQDLENYIRDAAGLPNILEEEWQAKQDLQMQLLNGGIAEGQPGQSPQGAESPQGGGNDPGPKTSMSGRKAPGQSNVPAGPRSAGPNAKTPGIHQPNENAARGTNLRKDLPMSADAIKASIRASVARAVLKGRTNSRVF